MTMFLIMGFVSLIALIVIGGLFYFMHKESQRNANGEAVPITDVAELKSLSPDDPRMAKPRLPRFSARIRG